MFSVQYNSRIKSRRNQKRSAKNKKIKPFVKKYKKEGINFPSEKDDWKKKMLLIFCMLKKKKYILLIFENITQIVKSKLFL